MYILAKGHFYIIIVSLLALTLCICAQSASTSPSSTLVYDTQNQNARQQELNEIYFELGKYYQGVEEARLDLLAEVFHESWFMRDDDTEEGQLNVESKSEFINRVRNHGSYPGYATHRIFATVSLVNENLAFVQVDKTTSGNSTNFFLIKQQEQWYLLDKLWVTASNQQAHQADAYTAISTLVQRYLQAVKDGDRHTLSQFMHHKWNLIQINTQGVLQKATLGEFFEGNASRYTNASTNSINIFQNKLAIVRLDWDKKRQSSFLIFYKIKGQWLLACERSSASDNTP